MPDPDQYAAEQAALLRDDWQFSRLFSKPAARPGFTALLALRTEMQQLLAHVNEPGVAAMKFEWWRTEIERGFAGNAQHPLARALGKHLAEAGSAPEYCLEIIDAAETESETPSFMAQDFQLYLYRSGGVLAEQLALLSGANARNMLDAARRLGQLKRFTDMLLSVGAMFQAGQWLFPIAWLRDNQLDSRTVLHKSGDPRTDALLNVMLESLDRERIETRTAMNNIDLPPAVMLQWTLAQRDYRRMRDNPAIMLATRPVKGNELVRLWTAWRGARAANKSNRQD